MIPLIIQQNPNHHFIRVEEGADGLWAIRVGRWWMNHNDAPQLETQVITKLDKPGLRKFAEELARAMQLQSPHLIRLELPFFDNEAQLALEVCTMKPGTEFYSDSLLGLTRIEASIDSEYSCVRPLLTGFEEEHNLEFSASYKSGNALRWKLSEYFLDADLKSFITELRDKYN